MNFEEYGLSKKYLKNITLVSLKCIFIYLRPGIKNILSQEKLLIAYHSLPQLFIIKQKINVLDQGQKTKQRVSLYFHSSISPISSILQGGRFNPAGPMSNPAGNQLHLPNKSKATLNLRRNPLLRFLSMIRFL